MKNFLRVAACLFALNSECPAQEHAQVLIYSAEIRTGHKDMYVIYDHTGRKIFDHPVDWAHSNLWDWIFVNNNTTGLKEAFDYTGKPLGIDSIEESKTGGLYENRVAIMRYGKWGFYDREGVKRIGHQFDSASSFSDNEAVVMAGNEIFYIDTSGQRLNKKYVADKSYDIFEQAIITVGMYGFQHPDFTIVEIDGKRGLADKNLNMLVPAQYDELMSLMTYFQRVTVSRKGKYGVVSLTGTVIIPIKYMKVFVLNDYLPG